MFIVKFQMSVKNPTFCSCWLLIIFFYCFIMNEEENEWEGKYQSHFVWSFVLFLVGQINLFSDFRFKSWWFLPHTKYLLCVLLVDTAGGSRSRFHDLTMKISLLKISYKFFEKFSDFFIRQRKLLNISKREFQVLENFKFIAALLFFCWEFKYIFYFMLIFSRYIRTGGAYGICWMKSMEYIQMYQFIESWLLKWQTQTKYLLLFQVQPGWRTRVQFLLSSH